MTDRDLYDALVAERYGLPPAPPVRPVHVSRRRADAADLFGVGGVLHSPPEPTPDADVLRMADHYRWSPRQIGAVLRLNDQQVARILARHGRGPALEEGTAA